MFNQAFYGQFDCLQLRRRDNYAMSVYQIKHRKIHIFLHLVLFNPRMNSSFIILLLKKDLELQNEDIMMKEVERLLYLNTETTKHQSNVYSLFFLLMFSSVSCSFFRSASKTTRRNTKLILIQVFAMCYVITWRPYACSIVYLLPVS